MLDSRTALRAIIIYPALSSFGRAPSPEGRQRQSHSRNLLCRAGTCPRRVQALPISHKIPLYVIARSAATWQRSRSRGTSVTDAAYPLRVQSRAGNTEYVQTCSPALSAASRSYGAYPRLTLAVTLIIVRFRVWNANCAAVHDGGVLRIRHYPCRYILVLILD